jgi:hypothetical protein
MADEIKEFAEASDLLADSEGTKDITVKGKKLQIRKITIGELSDILKVTKDSELDQYIWLVTKCLTQPKIDINQARRMNHALLFQLALEIQKFSGLDKKAMEKLQNLLTTES